MADFKISRIRFTWQGTWAAGTAYTKDDIVRYGGKVFVCLIGHTAEPDFYADFYAVDQFDDPLPKWGKMFDGFEWKDSWEVATFYSEGDIVKYGGTTYLCTESHTSASTITLGLEEDLEKWQIYSQLDEWKIDWNTTVRYKVNDIVKYGGLLYRCVTAHTSAETFALGLEENQVDWELVATAEDWKNNWAISTRYKVNDIVRYGAIVYRCIDEHTSAATIDLGLEENQSAWEIVISGIEYKFAWASVTRYKANDLVKYGPNIWLCTVPHLSSASFEEENWNVWLPGLGFENAWISSSLYQPGDIVTYGGYSYISITNNDDSVPSTSSSDWTLLTKGYNFREDWLTAIEYKVGNVVRRYGYLYTCLQDHDSQEPPNTSYWELVVPGTHWKSEWATTTDYVVGDLVTFISSVYICKQKHTSGIPSRPDNDTVNTYWDTYIEGFSSNVMHSLGDLRHYESGQVDRFAAGNDGQVLRVDGDSLSWRTFGEVEKVYYVAPQGIDDVDAGYGLTLGAPFRTIRYACLNAVGPATIFIKTGVYEEILPISVPANVALVGDELRSVTVQPAEGYEGSNMFYVRNGSGIRNMTLQGLTGTLGLPNSYGTRRPTAGAFVSLDPGSGGNDTSVWITSRSPYVQNVSTFGTACVGLKVDGALHNGGNDSIVANDFTQIISDGIGAWVTNNARAELVSVFTYYCHIGYLSEAGGKIRGTNGNNSYGTYGSVAENYDPGETPISGVVNNRYYDAQVSNIITNSQEILAIEYSNAGQDYSSASINFSGTGLGASASLTDVRNNAIFEVRVTDPGDSSAAGGNNYLNVINNAQSGDNVSITIAESDVYTETEYLGMRLFIIAGKGVGQYGYITSYDTESKIITISKDSDGTPGWDHVASGYSIETTLDETTQYNIEPRVIAPTPAGGSRAIIRAKVVSGRISEFKILDPGSNYTSTPILTITDPNNTVDVSYSVRIGNGVLGIPTFSNRGTAYQTATASITGSGFADIYPLGQYIILSNLTLLPGPGDNLVISGINDVVYRIVNIEPLGGSSGAYTARITVSPTIDRAESPNHNTSVIIRQAYSQVRLTGHDFLDIGVGNITNSNYPNIAIGEKSPENEVVESGGGRVFYTSTDQDGNFRVGELFKVEQSTGIVTLNASFFTLTGLEELRLGGVTLGGTGAVVREFSTDATFVANSNNIVPTQRAIRAYVGSRIGGGGSDLNVSAITAGQVRLFGQNIATTTGEDVIVDKKMVFTGGVSGSLLAMSYLASGGIELDADGQTF